MNHHLARAAAEWRWFFNQAKSEMGIRSSWDPLVQLALTGGARARSSGSGEREEKRRDATYRHARIEQALRRMPMADVALIRLTCDEPTWPLRQTYGDLGNAAHLTDAAVRALAASRSTRDLGAWLDRLALKYAVGRAGSHGLDAIEAIRLGTEALLWPARESYVKALGALPQRRVAC